MAVKLGNGNWAVKEDKLLAYNDNSGLFFNKEFDFTRGSTATYVGRDGLIASAASGVPRIDFTNDTKGHLLLEPSRTNFVNYSEDFSQWTAGSNTSVTFESDIVAPDGSLGVYRLTLPAQGGTFLASNTFTGQNPLALSIYAKSVNSNNDFNFYDGSNPSSTKTATDEWQRFGHIGNGGEFVIVNFGDTFETDIYIWGAQAEAGDYLTSLINTTGAASTRNADVCNNSGSAQDFNSEEGVLYADISFLESSATANNQLSLSDGSSDNRIMIYPLSNTQLGLRFNADGSQLVSQTVTVSSLIVYSKIAIKWGNGNYSLYQNGSEVYTQTIASTQIGLDKLNLSSVTGTSNLKGKVRNVQVFTEALTDEQLEKLTS